MGFAIEAAIIFFFENFVNTFGGKKYLDNGRSFLRLIELGNWFVKTENVIKFSKDAHADEIARGITKHDLTEDQILSAMNAVNEDLEFTIEIHTCLLYTSDAADE